MTNPTPNQPSSAVNETQFQAHGYKRIEYNGGVIIAYRKYFTPDQGFYIEARFNEYEDIAVIPYLVLPSCLIPLRGLRSIEEIELLRQLLEKGCHR